MTKKFLLDREVEAATNGRLSVSRLRKDRLGARIFPYYKVGKSCFYTLEDIESAILKHRQGGDGKKAA